MVVRKVDNAIHRINHSPADNAISCQWKKHLKQEQQAATINLPEIDMLTCKTIYKSLIDCQSFPPPTAEKRLIECGFDIPFS